MAKVLAVIGLLFFCVGIRFLFVKENQQHPAATIEISGASGAMSVVQVRGDASAIRAMIGAQ